MKGTPINNDTQTMLSVNRSCCGKSFNASNAEIIGSVYVDDDYIKREAVDWIQKNINKYKFIGKEARDLKITLKNYIGSIPNLNEINRILVEFFEIYANNPFCVENGIGVTEKSYIIGKSLDCYFVNYKDGIDIPFGCLEHFVHNKVEIVQNEYMEKAKDFAVSSVKTSLSCIQNIETNLQKTEKNHYATFLRFCIGVLTLVLSCIYVIYCATKVDWINIEYISERSANWYQIVGFAAEKGFIIGHNCSLNHILLGLASFWLVYIAITNIKVVKEYKNAKNYEKLKKINNYMLTLKDS